MPYTIFFINQGLSVRDWNHCFVGVIISTNLLPIARGVHYIFGVCLDVMAYWWLKPWTRCKTWLRFHICFSGWWFGTFSIFHTIWDNPSHWLISFRGVAQPPTSFPGAAYRWNPSKPVGSGAKTKGTPWAPAEKVLSAGAIAISAASAWTKRWKRKMIQKSDGAYGYPLVN